MGTPIVHFMIPMLNYGIIKNMEFIRLAADMENALTDEDVDQVVGGYSQEHWERMTPEERVAAYNESKAKRKVDGNAYCAFYDPNA